MSTGITKNIIGNTSVTEKYEMSSYDDILNITSAIITLTVPGDIFTNEGNDTVFIVDSTISGENSCAFYLGQGNDILSIQNSTLNTEIFAGSGSDTISIVGNAQSHVNINNNLNLGEGDDILEVASSLNGTGNLIFGNGYDILRFNGGIFSLSGNITGLENLETTANGGSIACDLYFDGNENNVTLAGNINGTDNQRKLFWSNTAINLITGSNISTNVAWDITSSTLAHTDGGSLEFKDVGNYAITADNSTISLHNVTFSQSGTGGIFANDATLSLTHAGFSNSQIGISQTDGTLSLEHSSLTNHSGQALDLQNTNLTGADVSFSGNQIAIQSNADINLTSAKINNNATGVCQSGGNGTFISASFSQNTAGAIHHTGGTLYLANGKAYDNIANCSSSNTVGSSVAEISSNTSQADYEYALGGVIQKNGGTLILTDIELKNNSANVKTDLFLSSNISYNYYSKRYSSFLYYTHYTSAVGLGNGHYSNVRWSSAVYSYWYNYYSSRVIEMVYKQNASAFAFGGAGYQNGGDCIIQDAIVNNNTAIADITRTEGTAGTGIAKAYGGAFYFSGQQMDVTSATFTENKASCSFVTGASGDARGGALYIQSAAIVNLNDTIFTNNSATDKGGAIYYAGKGTLTYSVSTGTNIVNSGNSAYCGGFLCNEEGNIIFDISSGATLTIGVKNGSSDSIAGAGVITKSGTGSLTIFSEISEYSGKWIISQGEIQLQDKLRHVNLSDWTIGIDSILTLSEKDDTVSLASDKNVGIINFGAGKNTLNTNGYTLSAQKILFESLTITGDGSVTADFGWYKTTGGQLNLILAGANIKGNLTGTIQSDTLSITQDSSVDGDIFLGQNTDKITATAQTTFGGIVNAGADNDILTFASVSFQGQVDLGDGDDTLKATGNAEFKDSLTAGRGNDTFEFTNVEFGKAIDLGDGDNSISVTGDAKFSGIVTAGAGNDIISFANVAFENDVKLGNGTNSVSTTGLLSASASFTLGDGNDTISCQSVEFFEDLNLGKGTNTVTVSDDATFKNIYAGDGKTSINLNGAVIISGDIALGDGSNTISLRSSLDMTGKIILTENGTLEISAYPNAVIANNTLTVCFDASASLETITYDWADIVGVDKVRILVSNDPSFQTYELAIGLYNQTQNFTIITEKNNFIQIQAQNEDGWSQLLLPDTTVPDQVSGFTMTGTTAVWDATHDNLGGNGIKQYNIQVASDANFNSVIGTYTSMTNSYSFASYADGNYFIRIQAEDYTGNKGEWSNVENLLIDTTVPVAPGLLLGQASGSTLTAQWSAATDVGSGVKEYKIEFSKSSSFSTIAHSATVSGTSYTATDLTDGTYYFRVLAIDNVNNTGSWSTSASAIVDTTEPEVVSGVSVSQKAGIISLKWNATSDSGVGVKEYNIQYSTDINFASIAGTLSSSGTSCNISNLADGNYYFRVQGVDKNGNTGSWSNTITTLLDSTAPTTPTGLFIISDTYSATLNWNAASDALSGVKEYEYIISTDSNFSSTAFTGKTSDLSKSISGIGYGTYYFKVRAIDNYGNVGDWSEVETFVIADATKPELTISGNPTSWTNQPVTLSAEATDTESGIKTIEYSTDNKNWQTGSSISVNANGIVYFRTTDNNGNITTKSVSVVKIDTTAPTFEISGNTDKLTNHDVILSVTAEDSVSGIKSVQYSFDNSSWLSGSTVIVDTNKTVYFKVTDNAGNVTEKSVAVNNIDKVVPNKPTASADITSVTNGNVTISATFSNDTVSREYSLDNKTWKSYTAGIMMFANGKVYFRGTDAAGNISAITTYEVTNIDKIAPNKPTASADITSATNQDVTVSATFTNDTVIREYSLNSNIWYSYTSAIIMSANGIVYFRGIDNANNVSEITTYEVSNIDRVAPDKPTVSANITTATKGNVTVSATFSSDTVIKEYSLDNKNWEIYTSSIVFEQNGVVYFRGTDEAGNVSEVTEYKVANIDKVSPVKPVATSNNTNPTNSDVTVEVAFSHDSVVKQYRIGNGEWQNYIEAFTVSENGTIYFRAEDAAGNESTNEFVISNIDKAAPAVPSGFNETVSGYNATLDWSDASDIGVSGLKGYYVRYGLSDVLTGGGKFIAASEFVLTDLAVGTYFYQVKTEDKAGNISEWSAVQSFEIVSGAVQNLRGDSNGLSWEANPEVYWYIVEYSTDNFAHVISFEIDSNKVDFHALPAGTYQWRVKAVDCETVNNGNNIASQNSFTEPQEFVSNADGNTDVFFANANGKWVAGYAAQHTGILNGWSGTNEQLTLAGKNKLADIFEGSSDANILVLTDDTNGDALCVDDVYTAFGKNAARLSQIDEIRAGLGDDIVDMTSQRFAYIGDGVKIYGGLGNDIIWSNNGSNMLFGDAGNDRIVGGSDDNIIIGGIGNDSMHGGGGDDIFCFGGDWGNDTVEQLAGGSVTLWFEDGSASNWNATTLTYSDGANSVKVSGVDTVTLKFGAESSDLYDELSASGCFDDAASEKIFEDKNKGFLA